MNDRPSHLSLEWIPAQDLRIDPAYQRVERPDWIRKLSREWDWDQCANLSGNRRDDGFVYLTNGQQRRAAMMLKDPTTLLPVVVTHLPGVRQEAAQFLGLDNVRRLTMADKFKANIIAGEPTAILVAGILDDLGLTVGNHVQAIGALHSTCKTYGTDALAWALRTLQLAFGSERGSFAGPFVNGLARFVHRHGATVESKRDYDRFVAMLQRYTVETWTAKAANAGGNSTAGFRLYKAIVAERDKGRTTGRIVPKSAEDES